VAVALAAVVLRRARVVHLGQAEHQASAEAWATAARKLAARSRKAPEARPARAVEAMVPVAHLAKAAWPERQQQRRATAASVTSVGGPMSRPSHFWP
jgi:hypothetical protein